jgi:hypothetical protein
MLSVEYTEDDYNRFENTGAMGGNSGMENSIQDEQSDDTSGIPFAKDYVDSK